MTALADRKAREDFLATLPREQRGSLLVARDGADVRVWTPSGECYACQRFPGGYWMALLVLPSGGWDFGRGSGGHRDCPTLDALLDRIERARRAA